VIRKTPLGVHEVRCSEETARQETRTRKNPVFLCYDTYGTRHSLLSQFFSLIFLDQLIYIVKNMYVCKVRPRTGHEGPVGECMYV